MHFLKVWNNDPYILGIGPLSTLDFNVIVKKRYNTFRDALHVYNNMILKEINIYFIV